MTETATKESFTARLNNALWLRNAIEKLLKTEKNPSLKAILIHCDSYVGPLVHQVESNRDSPDPDDMKKLDKIEAASRILSAYQGYEKDNSPEASDRLRRLDELFKKPDFKEAISKSRSSDFVEKIKQICTLGLINLKRMVTGHSEGERTFNKIQSEIKLAALPDTPKQDSSSPKLK